jgi:hypothetical protein
MVSDALAECLGKGAGLKHPKSRRCVGNLHARRHARVEQGCEFMVHSVTLHTVSRTTFMVSSSQLLYRK